MGPSVNDNPPNEEYPDKVDALSLEDAVNMMQVAASDSEDEDVTDFGYQLLPQEPTENEMPFVAHQDPPVVEAPIFISFQQWDQVADLDKQDEQKLSLVSHSTTREEDLTMDSEHIEVIKASMAGFQLPPSSIPAWANVIPEDQWKKQLFSMINNRDSNDQLRFETEKDAEDNN